MKLETNLKIQRIYRSIIGIVCIVGALFMANEGIRDYKVSKFADSAREVPLANISKYKPDGNLIKIADYEIDIRKRIRALPDKSSVDDLHILVPLRVPGERSDAPIQFLFRMEEGSANPISEAYRTYQDSGTLVLTGEAIFAEIVLIDDLPGNVPNVVRNNDRIAKNAIVFSYLPIRRDTEANFIAAGIFLAIAIFIFWRIRREQKKAKPKFY